MNIRAFLFCCLLVPAFSHAIDNTNSDQQATSAQDATKQVHAKGWVRFQEQLKNMPQAFKNFTGLNSAQTKKLGIGLICLLIAATVTWHGYWIVKDRQAYAQAKREYEQAKNLLQETSAHIEAIREVYELRAHEIRMARILSFLETM